MGIVKSALNATSFFPKVAILGTMMTGLGSYITVTDAVKTEPAIARPEETRELGYKMLIGGGALTSAAALAHYKLKQSIRKEEEELKAMFQEIKRELENSRIDK